MKSCRDNLEFFLVGYCWDHDNRCSPILLIQSVEKLITMIGQKSELNVDQITTLLKKIQIEGDKDAEATS